MMHRLPGRLVLSLVLVLASGCRSEEAPPSSPGPDATAIAAAASGTDTLRVRADRLLGEGQYEQAAVLYERLPTTPDILKNRGIAQIRSWRLQAGLSTVRQAREHAPQDIEVAGYLAEGLTWAREFDEAFEVYRWLLAADSTNRAVRLSYAQALAWNKQYGDAVEQYQRVLQADPSSFRAHLGLGETLAWQKRLGAALAEYRAAGRVAADPRQESVAHGRIAQVLAWQGDVSAAVASYERALALNAKNVEALLGLAEAHEWRQQYPQAKRRYEQVLDVEPENPTAKAKLLQLMWVK